ncbi:hypothetical protein [Paenibacillus maysiensis]|uniref:hypothetical protein n=1 Tax=Paenibacillus maysiensis TaxID=1155954 RepID=UPI00046FD951|nr:hypothetical protein [Paenibacillus maysiensis]
MTLDLLSTIKGSDLEHAFHEKWDLERIQSIVGQSWEEALDRQDFWHDGFEVEPADWFEEVHIKIGYEMAKAIKKAKENGQKIGFLFPISPTGQYRWCVYFIRQWKIKCDHVYGFSMDDWSDMDGNDQNVFNQAIIDVFYNPLGEYTVPENQRNYATVEGLPSYAEKMRKLQEEGGKIVLVYSVGWPGHFAFNDSAWADAYDNMDDYLKEDYRIAGKVDWMTFEENSCMGFKSNFTAVSARANSVSTGLMSRADYSIGGILANMPGTSHNWQGLFAWITLRYRPDMYMPCSILPTIPGKFFIVKDVVSIKEPYKLRVD